jgi:hypothetical protein
MLAGISDAPALVLAGISDAPALAARVAAFFFGPAPAYSSMKMRLRE